MEQKEEQPTRMSSLVEANVKATRIAGQVGCLTLLMVIGGLFLGIFLDKWLGTKPLFILLFVLGSAPLSLFLVYIIVTREMKSYKIAKSDAGMTGNREENDSGGRT